MRPVPILAVALVAFGCSKKSDEKQTALPACTTKNVEGGFCIQLPPGAPEKPELTFLYPDLTYEYRALRVVTMKLNHEDDWPSNARWIQGTVPDGEKVETSELPTGGMLMQWRNKDHELETNVLLHRGLQVLWCNTTGEEVERVNACKSLQFL